MKSTKLKKTKLPRGINTFADSMVDKDGKKIFWLNKNSKGRDGVYMYDVILEKTYLIFPYK